MCIAAVETMLICGGRGERPKIAGKEEATEASASISPHDITVRQGNILPVEYWAHPF